MVLILLILLLFLFNIVVVIIILQFGGLEAMITGLCDQFPNHLRRNREIFVGFVVIFIYLCALPTCTYVSIYSCFVAYYYILNKICNCVGFTLCTVKNVSGK